MMPPSSTGEETTLRWCRARTDSQLCTVHRSCMSSNGMNLALMSVERQEKRQRLC